MKTRAGSYLVGGRVQADTSVLELVGCHSSSNPLGLGSRFKHSFADMACYWLFSTAGEVLPQVCCKTQTGPLDLVVKREFTVGEAASPLSWAMAHFKLVKYG